MSRTPLSSHRIVHSLRRFRAALLCAAALAVCAGAQNAAVVPNVVEYKGTVADLPVGKIGAVFALYKEPTDRVPLWQEAQSVDVDVAGHDAVLLGANSPLRASPLRSSATAKRAGLVCRWTGERRCRGCYSPACPTR